MPWFCWLFSKNKKETRVKRWRIQNKYRLLQIWSRRVSPADGGRRVSKLEPTKLSPLRDWFLLEREFFDGRLCESSSSNGVLNWINKKKIFFEMTKQSPSPNKKKERNAISGYGTSSGKEDSTFSNCAVTAVEMKPQVKTTANPTKPAKNTPFGGLLARLIF